MEVNNFILYKGEKIPYVNTPLNREEIWSLKDNYDRFIINDVRRGTAKFFKGEQINKSYVLDVNFKHVFYAVASLFAVYKIFRTKKTIEKTVKRYNPIKVEKNFSDSLKGWHIREEPTVHDVANGKMKQ